MPAESFQWELSEVTTETEMYRKPHYSTPHRPALWKHLIAFTSPLTAEKPKMVSFLRAYSSLEGQGSPTQLVGIYSSPPDSP